MMPGLIFLIDLVVEAVALQVADLEVLHHDVDGLRELANDLLSRGLGEIDRDRALVAVGAEEERVVVVRLALRIDQIGRSEDARIVAAARTLDLDHLGAEVGEHLGRQRAREHARQIEHLDAGERKRRHSCFLWAGQAWDWSGVLACFFGRRGEVRHQTVISPSNTLISRAWLCFGRALAPAETQGRALPSALKTDRRA